MLILNGPAEPVVALSFAADAATLYAIHGYVGVHAWNLADRTGSGLVAGGQPVFGEFVVHPGGKWTFGRRPSDRDDGDDNDACLIDLAAGRARAINFLGVVGQHVALSPDGSRAVTVGHSHGDKARPARNPTDRLYCWKITAGGAKYEWHLDTPEDAQPWRVVFAGNATLVSEDWIPDPKWKSLGFSHHKCPRLAVRSAATGKVLRVLDSPTELIEQLLASPDGKQVVVRRGTALWVYDATNWKKKPRAVEGKHWNPHEGRAAAFHPSRPYLLLANNGPSVLVFDTSTWKQVRKWKWDAGTLRSTAVSPDGTLAAAGSARGAVVVWDLDL